MSWTAIFPKLGRGRFRKARGFAIGLAFTALTGCGFFVGQEAPVACGFPDGTALSFAGRSTTADLNVQEAVGDPMSHELADIFITRDALDQGERHGRLVCAIFVNQPGFVEVTVHPADGGRVEAAQPQSEGPSATPLPSGFIEITTHCGLDFVRIEFEGRTWRFDVDDEGNPPPGWGFNTTVVELKPGPDGPIVIGPGGSEWELIPADENSPPGICM